MLGTQIPPGVQGQRAPLPPTASHPDPGRSYLRGRRAVLGLRAPAALSPQRQPRPACPARPAAAPAAPERRSAPSAGEPAGPADSSGIGGLTGEGAGQAERPRSPDVPPARRLGAPLCADPLPGLPVRWGDPARGSGKAAGRTSQGDGLHMQSRRFASSPVGEEVRATAPHPHPELEGRLWSSDAVPGNWKPLGAELSRSPSGGCGKGPRDPWRSVGPGGVGSLHQKGP